MADAPFWRPDLQNGMDGADSFDAGAYLDNLMSGGGSNALSTALGGGAGSIAPLQGVQLDAPPILNTDPASFLDFQNQMNDRIGGAFNYDVPMADTALLDGAPQAALSQYGGSPQLDAFLNSTGFDPSTRAYMETQAREAPAMAGQQQLGQMRRALSEAGISGPAAAGYLGDVARNTGYQQGQNLQNVALANADVANKNRQFGVGLQTNIGMTNAQQANMMALQNANMMFQALRENQNAQNSMNQFNTNNQVQQQQQKAGNQANYTANSGLNFQNQQNANENENANKLWGQELQNTNYQWQNQLLPWQEQNQRYGQAVGTLGSWGQ